MTHRPLNMAWPALLLIASLSCVQGRSEKSGRDESVDDLNDTGPPAGSDDTGERSIPVDTGSPIGDRDGDGYAPDEDCDDGDSTRHPGALEACDGVDSDCDGLTDDEELDAIGCKDALSDEDGDGYGSDATYCLCEIPAGSVSAEDGGDCDDTDGLFHPGAAEGCNDGVDYNCDGVLEGDGETDCTIWYRDADRDGYGDPSVTTCTCAEPGPSYVDNGDDCDDSRLEVTCTNYYHDSDGDGFGDMYDDDPTCACEAPTGMTGDHSDCDDDLSSRNPDAVETCGTDRIDDNCNGEWNEADATGCTDYYLDEDGDEYGSLYADPLCLCEAASPFDIGVRARATDCDDGEATIHPSASEDCDGVDNNCVSGVDEGLTDSYYPDEDGDGWGNADGVTIEGCPSDDLEGYVAAEYVGDCDDADVYVHPDQIDLCDYVDNNCDGSVDEDGASTWYADDDGDLYGDPEDAVKSCDPISDRVENNGDDCDDDDPSINPLAVDECDGVDNDCNDYVDDDRSVMMTWYYDSDRDGYGSEEDSKLACDRPSTRWTDDSSDCDDDRDDVNPDAVEMCDSRDNDCDGIVDESYDATPSWGGGSTSYACEDGSDYDVLYYDQDADDYGVTTVTPRCMCTPLGYFTAYVPGDCGPTDSAVNPDACEADEAYNCDDGVDNDCDNKKDSTPSRSADSDCDTSASPVSEACAGLGEDTGGDTGGDDTGGDDTGGDDTGGDDTTAGGD